jgi:putative Holliday junction resolvase
MVQSRRWLALDVGGRRTGLAVSDASGTLARPLGVVTASDPLPQVMHTIGNLQAESDGLSGIVVGRPLRLDGTPHQLTGLVDRFVARLRSRTSLPVVFQDERLSSVEAESRLVLRERDWRRRKAKLDAAAAAVILQDYLDSQAS